MAGTTSVTPLFEDTQVLTGSSIYLLRLTSLHFINMLQGHLLINHFKKVLMEKKKKNRVCLVTFFPFIFCFQKQVFIFETKKLVWQPKINRKQKLFSKLNL